MTDGLFFGISSTDIIAHTTSEQNKMTLSPDPAPILDLSTFDAWIAIQQVEVSIDLLYRIAADLAANKGWSGVAFDVRRAADDLKTLTRHGARKDIILRPVHRPVEEAEL